MGTTRRRVASVAIINPLGDFGINQYSHELAEGLSSNGVCARFYTSNDRSLPEPAGYSRYHELGRMILWRFRHAVRSENVAPLPAAEDWIGDAIRKVAGQPGDGLIHARPLSKFRKFVLTVELALHLKLLGHDVVWTQWPDLEPYGGYFRALCRSLGMRVVHTVHNVLPHEPTEADKIALRRVYRECELLFVHSECALRELTGHFPEFADRTRVTRHGLYTMYPRRKTARDRLRSALGLKSGDVAVLFVGGIRPYKNVDALIEAMSLPGCTDLTVIVAGVETHYPDAVPGLPLGRTDRLARQFGVRDRVRLIPRSFSITELAELFEAVDIEVLPYISGSGSGMLLLGMTFGKHIVATRIGGADEYLANYPAATILDGPGPGEVAAGLSRAAQLIRSEGLAPEVRMPELEWRNIARVALDHIESALF